MTLVPSSSSSSLSSPLLPGAQPNHVLIVDDTKAVAVADAAAAPLSLVVGPVTVTVSEEARAQLLSCFRIDSMRDERSQTKFNRLIGLSFVLLTAAQGYHAWLLDERPACVLIALVALAIAWTMLGNEKDGTLCVVPLLPPALAPAIRWPDRGSMIATLMVLSLLSLEFYLYWRSIANTNVEPVMDVYGFFTIVALV